MGKSQASRDGSFGASGPDPSSTHLVSSQDLEGSDDLVGRVRVGRFPRHEVDEGLEGHDAGAVGIYDAHDAVELPVALATKTAAQVNRGEAAAAAAAAAAWVRRRLLTGGKHPENWMFHFPACMRTARSDRRLTYD